MPRLPPARGTVAGDERDLAVESSHGVTLALARAVRNWERDTVATEEAVVHGDCDAAFEGVRDTFAGNFADGLELGASLCVSRSTAVASSTCGEDGSTPSAHVRGPRDSHRVRVLVHEGLGRDRAPPTRRRGAVDLDAPVARYWPEFAAAGKDELPVR